MDARIDAARRSSSILFSEEAVTIFTGKNYLRAGLFQSPMILISARFRRPRR